MTTTTLGPATELAPISESSSPAQEGLFACSRPTGESHSSVTEVVDRACFRVTAAPRYEPEPVDPSQPRVITLGRSAPLRRSPLPVVPDGVDLEMRQFAIGAIKLVLEVMNRRRPVTQLSAVAIPHIADQFRTLLSSGTDRGGPPAALLRLHTQSIRPDVAEITVVYGRGDRVFAMGARVERRRVVMRAAEPGGARRRTQRCLLTAVTVG